MPNAENIIKVLNQYKDLVFHDKICNVSIPDIIAYLDKYRKAQKIGEKPDLNKVIQGLEYCIEHGDLGGVNCFGYSRWKKDHTKIIKIGYTRDKCPYGKCKTGCVITLARDALALLRLTEWRGLPDDQG